MGRQLPDFGVDVLVLHSIIACSFFVGAAFCWRAAVKDKGQLSLPFAGFQPL